MQGIEKRIPKNNQAVISGIRLQSLVDPKTEKTMAYEVLTKFENIIPEEFFANTSTKFSTSLFHWQINQLQDILQSGMELWFNLPVSVFMNADEVKRIMSTPFIPQLVVEIQDPENLLHIDENGINNIRQNILSLQKEGASVWLDDLKNEIFDEIKEISLPYDGVKIDKKEISTNPDFLYFIQKANARFGKILVEGIETPMHKDILIKSEVNLAQGYLWDEKLIPLKDAHPISHMHILE